MMKKKILVIDNYDPATFAIKEELENFFGELVDVFPKTTSAVSSYLETGFLIGKIIDGSFKDVINFYNDIEIFIIDVFLVNEVDKIGLKFANYIVKNKQGNYKIIIMSHNQVNDAIFNDPNVTFFSKLDHGKYYPQDLAQVVRNLIEKISIREKDQISVLDSESVESEKLKEVKPRQSSSQDERVVHTTVNVNDQTDVAATMTPPVNKEIEPERAIVNTFPNKDDNDIDSLDSYIKALHQLKDEKNWGYFLHRSWMQFRYLSGRSIDTLIYFSFFLLLISTTVYAVWSIIHTIQVSMSNTNTGKDAETVILKTCEHIFLYLLPIFIVFGFFNYYKNNSRVFLFNGRSDSTDEENSTKTMNLTKVLFISSIISYILIKTIEEIFFTEEINIVKLISVGILLLMLMSYFVFLDNKHQQHEKK